jgi:hypothetical protein
MKDIKSLDDLYTQATIVPRDMEKHLPYLRTLAEGCQSVMEISKRKESSVALAYCPGKITLYNQENGEYHNRLLALHPRAASIFVSWQHPDSLPTPAPESYDLLFIDSVHTRKQLLHELSVYGVRASRFIVMHDTVLHGQKGQDGGDGLVPAIKDFLDANPEWFIFHHTPEQYGLTVLGKQPADKPVRKIHLWPPGFGPGTELKGLLTSIGITEKPNCGCRARMVQMDLWGPNGCRERLDEIVAWMREGHEKWGWADKLKAGALATVTGLAFKINPLDPFPSLVNHAIALAEGKTHE